MEQLSFQEGCLYGEDFLLLDVRLLHYGPGPHHCNFTKNKFHPDFQIYFLHDSFIQSKINSRSSISWVYCSWTGHAQPLGGLKELQIQLLLKDSEFFVPFRNFSDLFCSLYGTLEEGYRPLKFGPFLSNCLHNSMNSVT